MSKKESIHKVGRKNLIPYTSQKRNRVSIFKNVLINNGNITAYYVLYPFNYEVYDGQSADSHIQSVYSILSTLYQNLGEIKLSTFRISDIVSKHEVAMKIQETAGIYNPDFKMTDEYKSYVKSFYQEYTILAIKLESGYNIDIETQGIVESVKQIFDTTVGNAFKKVADSVNIDSIISQNKNLQHTLEKHAVPANEKLVMNIYMNSLYPSYDLIYTDEMLERANKMLGWTQQEIIPHLGWFELSNSGIADFGITPKISYCSVITIVELPDDILIENFNIYIPGMRCNMKLLSKQDATLRFKRIRTDLKEEFGDSLEVNEDADEDSDGGDSLGMAYDALKAIKNGRILTDFDLNILIVADSKEELDKKKKNIIASLGQIKITARIAHNQAKTFIRSFIDGNPLEYYNTADLLYPLSFQIDNGTYVGDFDSNYASPVIGIS